MECGLDRRERRIYKRRYDIEVEECILTRVVEGFNPAKCSGRSHCEELINALKA